jgi:general secretion pathway protein C
MSLDKKVFAAPARLWMNWPLWGGMLAMLLLAKHAWVLFAPAERAVPTTSLSAEPAQAGQLFGEISKQDATASLNGIRPIGIFAHPKHGFAVMMTDRGQVGVGQGSEVAPGIRLVETHADHVVLERNGTRHRVDLDKAPVASGISPAPASPQVRGMTVPPAGGQMLDQLTPEQQVILQQQQRDLIRGRP